MSVATLPAVAERRVSRRYQPAYDTICEISSDPRTVGLVWDVSETGVSMLMANPPAPGEEVVGTLCTQHGGPELTRAMRVVHVRPLLTGDFFLGARFALPLQENEMTPFLSQPLPARHDDVKESRREWKLPKKG
ncbi:PilZ domain-containing protein [Zavarzinella formosa]|uniref:PilZ domain-containing protein n=1 Tax=Zavarzinella formosa TaxID=360055 RepID=UPI0002E1B30D|nr:PilZ domain-containing protein [Zavarzinella formosa]